MNKIVGIVKDFNVKSLHHQLEPVLLSYNTNWFRHIAVKVNRNNITEALSYMDERWSEFYPEYPFHYTFFDESLGKQYETEQKLGHLFSIFTAIAILIAGLGLISLASFTVNRRTNEIGIRKVLGSSVNDILLLFSKNFLFLVSISIIVGIPVAYYLMDWWLSSFAFRISISPYHILMPILSVLVIIFTTVGYQVFKAALTDPVKTLRDE